MKFRKASLKDAKGIANVLIKSYNIRDLGEGVDVFKEEIKKFHNYIVADDGKIAGIVTWIVHGLSKHQLCELDRIAVLPECRGKGIAKKLFNALVKDAKAYYKKHNQKLRKLYLLTHADNKRAHKFYEKLGFKHETTLKEHYYKNKDEFVYSMFFD
ncbi:MAG: GNAT family N-acetyltransferase [Candidatus Woesearchaeota archaeon]|nr:GNAT family N-acetyltransferase [Candidatus Woesearchaeota archaeon]|tara:strand:- start:1057 stop:1524 length:468 start_codon:yes stop_codon:yes gene_type:complete